MTFQDLISKWGSVRGIADALRVPKTTVYTWKQQNRIPRWRQCELEVLTGGELKAEPPIDRRQQS